EMMLRAENLERALVDGGRDLHSGRLGDATLAREAISLTHQGVAELDLVHDRRWRSGARDKLDAARRTSPASATCGRDVDAGRMGGAQDDAARVDMKGAIVRQDRERDAHATPGYHPAGPISHERYPLAACSLATL